jgi:hypothetical protein
MEIKDQQAPACYGFHACPGLPDWDARSESLYRKVPKDQQGPAYYYFRILFFFK